MKLCKDCRWISGATHSALCDHPKAHYQDVITGRVIEHRWQCETFRMPGPMFACGPNGKLWEPKEGGLP
jgi:hypothetical protein